MVTSYVVWLMCYVAVVGFIVSPVVLSLITSRLPSGDAWPMVLSALTVPAGGMALGTLWIVHVLYVLYKIALHGTPVKQLAGHLLILLIVLLVVVSVYIFLTRGQSTFIDPRATTADGLPMIFRTLERDNEKEVRAIIDAGADVNALGFHGATPGITAAMLEQWLYVNLLLEKGARLDVVDGRGFNVPYLAFNSEIDSSSSEYQNLAIVKQKIAEAGFAHWSLYTPKMVRRMVEAGQWPPKAGDVPMPTIDDVFYAIDANDVAAVQQYLLAGGDIDIANSDGETLLMRAGIMNRWQMAAVLLAQGADIKTVRTNGLSFVFMALNRTPASLNDTEEESYQYVRLTIKNAGLEHLGESF